MPQVSIRHYIPGDEIRISEIHERCYRDYSGFQPRTPGFWRWYNLLRPGLSEADILVATTEGTITACLTLCPNGAIIDPCYDPEGSGKDALACLIRAAEELALKRGLERITISPVLGDGEISEACRMVGMKPGRSGRIFTLSVVNHRAFIPLLLEAKSRVQNEGPPQGAFRLEVRRPRGIQTGESAVSDTFCLQIKGSRIVASDSEACDVRIGIEDRVLARIALGQDPSIWDWVLGRVVVRPLRRFRLARRFLAFLNLGPRFHFPRGGIF